MKYPLNIAGMEGHRVEVETSTWTSGSRLLLDGKIAPPGDAKLEYRLTDAQGRAVTIKLTGMGLDLLPRVTVDGVAQKVAPPLAWYEWMLILLPLTLVFAGGGLGGLCGGLSVSINLWLLRGTLPAWAKALAALAVTVAAYGLYFLAMLAIRPYLPHPGPAAPTYGSPSMPGPSPIPGGPGMPAPPPMPAPPSMPGFPGRP